MTPDQSTFLKEVFKEANGHIRGNDRKSLLVTGVYVGLFSVFLATFSRYSSAQSTPPSPWVAILVQTFFLTVGTCVYTLQRWYRAWKEHYVEVCRDIRGKFIDETAMNEFRNCLPFWTRPKFQHSKVSVDNVFQYLVLFINTIIVGIIAYEILDVTASHAGAIVGVIVGVVMYAITIGSIWKHVHRKRLFHV